MPALQAWSGPCRILYLIDPSARVVIRRRFDRVQRFWGDPPKPARRRWAWPVAHAVAMLLSPATVADRPAVPVAFMQAPSDAPQTNVARPSLPPRALLRIGTDDLRTQNDTNAIAFSPDGRTIAAADSNAPRPRVAVFDVRTGRQVKQLVAPDNKPGWVESVAFSPDGTRLLWGEQDGEVALWDLSNDRLVFREWIHDGTVGAVDFSPDGAIMASAGGDSVCLQRVAKPEEVVRELRTRPAAAPGRPNALEPAALVAGGSDGVRCLAFTPDGTRIIAGTSYGATVFIWRAADGQLLRKIPGTHGQSGSGQGANPNLNSLAVTPDGRRIMSVGQTTELRARTKLKFGPKNVTMSEVRFWDIESGQRLADYRGGMDYGFGFGALSRDGRRVAVGDFGLLRILDAATGQAERTIDLPGWWGRPPVFSPDGTLVAVPIDNAIAIFEVATGRRLHHDPSTPAGSVISAAWSPSGDRVVTAHSDGFVRAWDAATGRLAWHNLLAEVIHRGGWNAQPNFLGYSRDGKLVVAAGRRDDPVKFENGIVAIYEADSGRVARKMPQIQIRWAALAPDGRMLVVGTSNGAWDDIHFLGIEVETGRTRWANPPAETSAGFAQLGGMQFEAKSPWFDAALRDGEVIRFNSLTGHEQRRFLADGRTPQRQQAGRPRAPNLWEAAFSSDGRTLVTSQTEWVHVWDVKSGTMRRRIRHPHQHGCRLTLAPDGRTLATADIKYAGDPGDDTIRLYDIETGEQVLTLEPPGDRAIVLAFSPDSNRLFTGFGRSIGVVWDVRLGQRPPAAKD